VLRRPASRLRRHGRLTVAAETYAGVELGGTKCVVIVARGPADILSRTVIPTTSPADTLGAISAALASARPSEGYAALGIASFGPVDLDPVSPDYGHITSTPKPGWRGTDVVGQLGRAVGVPVGFDTDVNGAALAEIRWGAGQGADDFAYVTVGTGVGVGLIVNGQPTRGFAHCELGHIRVARLAGDSAPGSCPFHGDCVEGLVAGPALKQRLGERDLASVASDDPLWDSVAWTLAQLSHVIVCAAAPRAIAIGGGVLERQAHLLPRIEALLADSLNGYMTLPGGAPYVRAPGLGADAGPLGAIALAMGVRR
jgi:fructokinase